MEEINLDTPVASPYNTSSYQTPVQQVQEPETSGEDMLLEQIDAFRDKARQLQSFISAKERKVKELEALVRAKEAKNLELQQILAKKQEEADGIIGDVEEQVDRMLQSMKGGMDDLEVRIAQQVSNNEMAAAEQTKAVRSTLEGMTSELEKVNVEITGVSSKLEDVVDSGIKNVGTQIEGMSSKIEGVETKIGDVSTKIGTVDTKMETVTTNVETMTSALEDASSELSEKVHTENVKCYRNIQDLFKEFDNQEASSMESDKKFTSLKGQLGFLTCFTIINFLLTIVVVLCMLGVF